MFEMLSILCKAYLLFHDKASFSQRGNNETEPIERLNRDIYNGTPLVFSKHSQFFIPICYSDSYRSKRTFQR